MATFLHYDVTCNVNSRSHHGLSKHSEGHTIHSCITLILQESSAYFVDILGGRDRSTKHCRRRTLQNPLYSTL